MNVDYRHKYLKYKRKYLALKGGLVGGKSKKKSSNKSKHDIYKQFDIKYIPPSGIKKVITRSSKKVQHIYKIISKQTIPELKKLGFTVYSVPQPDTSYGGTRFDYPTSYIEEAYGKGWQKDRPYAVVIYYMDSQGNKVHDSVDIDLNCYWVSKDVIKQVKSMLNDQFPGRIKKKDINRGLVVQIKVK